MERISGFIDLDRLEKEEKIKIVRDGRIHSFKFNNEKYYVKECEYVLPYSELLAEELLKDFHLACAEYDLAIYNGKKGVISKNCHKENVNYISGNEIIREYTQYLDNNNKDSSKANNSLETLWNALLYRYRNDPKKEEIVFHLMDKIVHLFIFDLLTGQQDRNNSNYEIMEGYGPINLAPIYDNGGILRKNARNPEIRLVVDQDTNYKMEKEIEKFIKYSDEAYTDKINDSLWLISEDNLEKAFKKIEDKIDCKLDDEIKREYINLFKIHKEKIEKIIGNHKRKVIL